jgi:uncharacterized membrane protein
MAAKSKKENSVTRPANPGRVKSEQIKSNIDFNKSRSDRLAIFIAGAFGSITFLCICILVFVIWITLNLGLLPWLKAFDPFPFPELEMVVSVFAIILSVSVLISQNRQGRMEKVRQQIEFEVNIRAENEITKMLTMLHQIQKKLGINNDGDTELEQMKENLDIEQLHQKLDEDKS